MKKYSLFVAVVIAATGYSQHLISNTNIENVSSLIKDSFVEDAWFKSGDDRVAIAFASDVGYFKGTRSGKLDVGMTTEGRYGLPKDLVIGKIYDVTFEIIAKGDNSAAMVNAAKLQSYYKTGNNTIVDPLQNGYAPVAWETWSGQFRYGYDYSGPSNGDKLDPANYTALDASQEMYLSFGCGNGLLFPVYLDNITLTESLDQILNVDNLEKFNFSYAPNPVKDRMHVSATKRIKELCLFSASGQKVFKATFDSSKRSINISHLSKGIYIMKVTIDDTIGTYKIIKG